MATLELSEISCTSMNGRTEADFRQSESREAPDLNRDKDYEEAALYVRVGVDHEKFVCHPNGSYSKLAFNILHNQIFCIMEFTVCCLLMGLAIIEEPAWVNIPADNQAIVIAIHSALEIFFLLILTTTLILRFIWMKSKVVLFKAPTIAAIIMVVMLIEAIVVFSRRENHFRVTRCLRPVFFINSYLLVGVSRVFHQLIQCLKPIVDVILLLLLLVTTFSLAGYYLFADINPTYFDTYLKSFVSLFIAITTANHPDVFMEAYVRNRASPLFFIFYLFVTLFFFSNVLLGILYAHFNKMDKNRFKKLYLCRRNALTYAYNILCKDEGIDFDNFTLFMLEYNPRIPEHQVMCIFIKLQNESNNLENLSLGQFLKFYEMQDIKWKQIQQDGEPLTWYEHFPDQAQYLFDILRKIKKFKYFDSIMAFVVVLNVFFLTLYTLITSFYCGSEDAYHIDDLPIKEKLIKYCEENRFKASRDGLIGSFIFTIIYMIEILVRILAVGPVQYLKKRWNRYDSLIILLSFIFLCIEASTEAGTGASYLIFFRPVKLLRLMKLKKRYYKLISAMSYLSDRLASVLILFFVVFYFYSIIGMEVFQGAVYSGCCETALFGTNSYYQANSSEFSVNVYWLNNFDNIYQSFVILYEEMVVNNWFIQMEGFVSETSIFARVYFIAFWMTITVCLEVMTAYIVDAFVLSIQSSQETEDCKKHKFFQCRCNKSECHERFTVTLSAEKIDILRNKQKENKTNKYFSFNRMIRYFRRVGLDQIPRVDELRFEGKWIKTKEYLKLKEYENELEDWIRKEEQERRMRHPQEESLQTLLKNKMWKILKGLLSFVLE